MSDESKEIRSMRNMAWSRAKGELNSILDTYWGNQKGFMKMDALVKEFIDKVESEGCQE